jgi:hypothetical protein
MSFYYIFIFIFLLGSFQVLGNVTEVKCQSPKELLSIFIPLDFETQRSSVGLDQVEPLKMSIKNFIQANPHSVITNISVISSSSRFPVYKMILDKHKKPKKVIDPDSIMIISKLVEERGGFAKKILSEFKSIDFKISSQLSGPDYNPVDLNERFVTRMTPEFEKKVEEAFKKHEHAYTNLALKKKHSELLDEKEFPNLFLVKYKPFLGFKLTISGCEKEAPQRKMKSPDSSKQ